MFETSNPEVLLLYSYFAPHIRRLVYSLFPSKKYDKPETFYGTGVYPGTESINSPRASKNLDSSEPYFRQNQTALSATASNKPKSDDLTKRRKPRGSKIAFNGPLQPERRRRVNLLIVATGEAMDLLF